MRLFPPRRPLFGLLLLGLGGACRSSGEVQPGPHAPRSGAGREPSAVWLSHPDVAFREGFRTASPEGGTLLVGDDGTRILLDRAGRPGRQVMGSAEPLVGARFRAGRFTFLGASGRGYSTEKAEGPLVLDRDVQEPFVSAAWGGSEAAPLFVGIGSDGSAHVSRDLGGSWQGIESDRFFVKARRAGSNELVLESLPETTFRFHPREGLTRATPDESAILESFGKSERGPLPGSPRLPRLGDLGKLGVLDGVSGRVLVLNRGRSSKSLPAFQGTLGRGLVEADAKLPDSCLPEGVGTSAALEVVVCGDAGSPRALARDVFALGANEKSWRRVAGILRAADLPLALKVSASGLIAASGICSSSDPEPGCEGRGLYFLSTPTESSRGKSGTPRPVRVPIPETGQPLAFAFAGDSALFAVYQRVHDDHLVVYRVPSGPASTGSDGPSVRELDLTRVLRWSAEPESRAEVLPGSTDTVGLILTSGSGRLVLSLDAQLRLSGFGAPPELSGAISGSGSHMLAIDVRRKMAWESDNAGLSFEAVRVPAGLAEDDAPSGQLLACGASGCLVGSRWTRLGWSGLGWSGPGWTRAGSGDMRLTGPMPARPPRPEPRVFMRCEVVGEESGRLSTMPTAYDAVRGNVAWSEVLVERSKAAVSVVHALYGRVATVTHELLPASFEPERVALFVSQQVEGSAALRYRLPLRDGAELEQIEVAWDNRIEDTLRRELLTLPDVSPDERARLFELRLGDYDRSPRGAQLAKPWFVSVGSGRVYVGLHAKIDPAEGLFVLGDTAGGRQLDLGTRFLAKPPRGAQLEVFRVAERDVPVWLSGSGLTVTWANSSGSLVDYRLGMPDLPWIDTAASIAYREAAPEFSVRFDNVKSEWSKAYRLAAGDIFDGKRDAVRRVATAFDLPDAPRACSLDERTAGERGIYPQPKDRSWQIELARVGSDSARFDVIREVVFGSVGEPCLAMLEAELVGGSAGLSGRADARVLADPHPGAVSWLFRSSNSAEHDVSAVPLRCVQGAAPASQGVRTP